MHTEVLPRRQLPRAYQTAVAHVAHGQQAYIVCPVIGQGKISYLTAAETLFRRLSEHDLPTLRLGLVHGQMAAAQREETMQAFRAGQIDVLVATSVIEVGVDVPNATVMLVQNAERFGLAQLHQLRGRVGRGGEQACCILATGSNSPDVIDRLNVLAKTNDGFAIAAEDLARRGPGEVAGGRQHGLPDRGMAGLLSDTRLLVRAREDAFELVAQDPALARPEHQALRDYLDRHMAQEEEWTL